MKGERALVSIIVPSFRHERYVRQALNSCANSDYANIEIVIANDASPEDDDSQIRAWIREHPHVRTQYVRHDENRGVTRTLNECVDLCNGAYVAILAADDVLLPHSISRRVSFLEHHREKLAVFSDAQVIDDAGTVIFASGIEDLHPERGMSRAALRNDFLLPLEIVFNWSVPGPTFLARRELYETVGRYDETLGFEDWDMYLRIASINALGFLDDCTAQYRWHGSNYVKDLSSRRGNFDHFVVAARAAKRFNGIVRLYLRGYSSPIESVDGSRLRRVRKALLFRSAPHLLRGYRVFRRFVLLRAHHVPRSAA